MQETPDFLTPKQHHILLDVLSRFADKIDRVDVYGSRARGDHRPGSDIDLILAGDLSLEDVLRISVALDESYLSIYADVARYGDNRNETFAGEVARDARTLFTAQTLREARAEGLGIERERHWNTY